MRSDQNRLEVARDDEASKLDALFVAADRHLVEGDPGQQRGDQHERGGYDLAARGAVERTEQAGEQRADQREEEDRLIHRSCGSALE